MRTLLQDVAYGFRLLRKYPSFSLVAVAVIALGIGANSAIFSVVKSVLLHALPYDDPGRLVLVWEDASARRGSNRVAATPGNFTDWRNRNSVFTGLAAIRNSSLRLTDFEEPIVPLTHEVTLNYFKLLGVTPHLGRDFLEGEDGAGSNRVVMISYALWQKAFGGQDGIVNQSVALDGEEYTIIGVLPATFYSAHLFAVQPDLWVPLSLQGQEQDRRNRGLIVYGRLTPQTSLAEAQAVMDSMARNLAQEYPDTNQDWGVRLQPIREDVVGSYRSSLTLLLASVGFLLLIACANVANLTLTRASERSREIALRAALGAGRRRLARQILTESVLLAFTGGVVGLALAWWGVRPMARLIPSGARVPFVDEIAIDSGVLLFTFALTVLTGIVFGSAPAWRAGRWQLNQALKERARGGGGNRSRLMSRALVVSQVALSLLLLAGAGLMIQTFKQLVGFQAGFDAEKILTVRNSLRGAEFEDPTRQAAHFEELAQRLEGLPGVHSASATSFVPPLTPFLGLRFQIQGQVFDPGFEPSAAVRAVLPRYFETMGIPVVKGRAIDRQDRSESLPVAVINQALERFFQDQEALGSYLTLVADQPRQIVGIVGNVRATGTDPRPVPAIYLPVHQSPRAIMNLVIRAEGDPSELALAAEREAWKMRGSGNVYGIETLDDRIADLHWPTRLASLLLGGFALLALVIGAAGIYAVTSSTVAQRLKEIGVRVALGAKRGDIHRLVLGEGMQMAFLGVVVGLLASLGLTRLLSSQLYGVTPSDPLTLGSAAGILLLVAVAACLVPAQRATRIDPISVLHSE